MHKEIICFIFVAVYNICILQHMKKTNIKEFRDILRKFERENNFQNNQHCCLGITVAQCHALMEIGNDPQLKLTDLSLKLNLDKSTISRTIDGLVNIGLVLREIPQNNRRSTNISLTKQGKSLYDKINKDNNEFYSKAINHIPEEKRNEFVHLFSLFIEGMNQNRNVKC